MSYTEADGLSANNHPTAFCEDSVGNLWIGFYNGGLARYAAGRFTMFKAEDGLPPGQIGNLYLDRDKRLWIAAAPGGLARIDDTSAARPTFVRFTTAEGLSTNMTLCITEDDLGRVYVGTGRGVDRLDPVTGQVKHYTTADGLTPGQITLALRDHHGALWFSGIDKVSKLIPAVDTPELPPQIFISGVRITGNAQPFSDLGETDVRGLELAPHQNHLQIDFVALGFSKGETLQYQFKLEGADTDWQPLTRQRSVNYANLAVGRYRFLVRAVNAEEVFSSSTASLEFTILTPLWRRWWFLALTALVLGAAVYTDFRSIIRRRLALERVRARIAADLHDDIGANLTRITILSEVANHQLGREKPQAHSTLSAIANISRESVAAMRDIVWAINPKRDRLLDLTRRMRSFCSDIFTARHIEFRFRGPERDRELRLDPEVRRDVFLIFKEAVNNIVRHSQCRQATIELRIAGHWLVLSVSDDGQGMEMTEAGEGQGLASMRRRAASFGGNLEINTASESGTTVRLKVPIGGRFIMEKARQRRRQSQRGDVKSS